MYQIISVICSCPFLLSVTTEGIYNILGQSRTVLFGSWSGNSSEKRRPYIFPLCNAIFSPGRLCNHRADCTKACYDTAKVDRSALCPHSPQHQSSSCICGSRVLRIHCPSHMAHRSPVTFCNCIHTASHYPATAEPSQRTYCRDKAFLIPYLPPGLWNTCLSNCEELLKISHEILICT